MGKSKNKQKRRIPAPKLRETPTAFPPSVAATSIRKMDGIEWYESNLIWGSLGLTVTLALTVIATKGQDLRWLVSIAWACSIPFFWAVLRSFVHNRRLLTLGMVFVVSSVGFGFYRLYDSLPLTQHRLLSKEDSDVFIKALKAEVPQGSRVTLGCPAQSEVDCVFAGQFVEAFKWAGWVVESDRVERLTLAKPQNGVSVFARGAGRTDRANPTSGLWVTQTQSLNAVMRGFTDIGLVPQRMANPELRDGALVVYFGLNSTTRR